MHNNDHCKTTLRTCELSSMKPFTYIFIKTLANERSYYMYQRLRLFGPKTVLNRGFIAQKKWYKRFNVKILKELYKHIISVPNHYTCINHKCNDNIYRPNIFDMYTIDIDLCMYFNVAKFTYIIGTYVLYTLSCNLQK